MIAAGSPYDMHHVTDVYFDLWNLQVLLRQSPAQPCKWP